MKRKIQILLRRIRKQASGQGQEASGQGQEANKLASSRAAVAQQAATSADTTVDARYQELVSKLPADEQA
jgi:hypothetical protein